MYPILFSIGQVNFYSYGLMAALAFLATIFVVINLSKKYKLYFNKLIDYLVIIFIGGLVGARLSYFVLYYDQFKNWYDVFIPWQGALISIGGIIGVIIAVIIVFRKDSLKWLDVISVGFMLGLFFWRMGCFLAGDHPQVLSNSSFAINGEFPAILIESLAGLAAFPIFYICYRKFRFTIGLTFFLTITYYGAIRMIIDNFRVDPMLWGLKTGQIAGIVIAAIGIIGIIIVEINNYKSHHKKGEQCLKKN